MNIFLYSSLIVLLLAITSDATDVTRQLRRNSRTSIICSYRSPGVYETKITSKFTAILHISSRYAVKGDCRNNEVCQGVCASVYATGYEVIGNECRCVSDTTAITTTTTVTAAPVQSPVWSSAPVAMKATTTAPTVSLPITVKPTSSPTTAPSITGGVAYPVPAVVKTVYCSNPYGNPCGPGSACTDTDTGITCAPTNLHGCPAGCGPHSSCTFQSTTTTYECMCSTGFTRPKPYLPCISDP